METQIHLNISDFAGLCGVSRQTLIYYDKIGLFSPEAVDEETGYRYYSYRQLDIISIIYALKEIGTPLKEIKIYLDERTPERLVTLFEERKAKIDEEIKNLRRISYMMESRINMTKNSWKIDTNKMSIEYLPSRQIFVSNDISKIEDEVTMWKAILDFYEQCNKYKISYVYPIGDIVSRESLLKSQWHYPTCYFVVLEEAFFMKTEMKRAEDAKIALRPGGYYAVGHIKGDYDAVDYLYERLCTYIEAHGFEIIGNGYRESILDEVALRNEEEYLFRVEIQVEKKSWVEKSGKGWKGFENVLGLRD